MIGISECAAVTVPISTTYVGTLIGAQDDRVSLDIPGGCWLDSLDMIVDEASTTVAVIDIYLAWDSLGENPITDSVALAPADWRRGSTDASLILKVLAIEKYVTPPAGQTTAGKIYAFIKVDSGTLTIPVGGLRVNWDDRRS